jgi:hypothetical protein
MVVTSWYNGYSPKERDDKFKAMKKLLAKGELAQPSGSCALCNDNEVPLEYHDEDYGAPFIWEPPALLALCRHCHRDKLHKRFNRPLAWSAYVAHIRRGGYARDLKDLVIKKEVDACKAAIENNEAFTLKILRPYQHEIGKEWFANLRMDIESLSDSQARQRQ